MIKNQNKHTTERLNHYIDLAGMKKQFIAERLGIAPPRLC
jgi:hypothetical protein